ncbi:MAG: inosine monophosphate cyclohydrolase [Cyanobacteriota bacterium]
MARLALLSVSDKSGIVALAQRLVEDFQFDLISSGGTAKTLQVAGIPVTKVSDYTGAPEILGGRVKTLHPRIHGGILARRDLASDQADLDANQIRPLDLVVVNLYPFEETIAKPGVTVAEAVEQIDIGGPAMIRATAKNFAHTTVLTHPNQYETYLTALEAGDLSLDLRRKFAGEAFALTNAYDQAIANYFSQGENTANERFGLSGILRQSLRYGENPHQSAGWYQTEREAKGWGKAEKLQGKELSYNNLVDLEAARRIINEFDPSEPAVAILKHTNPCGVALAPTLADAYQKAFAADATSAFGGIVALNQPIDADTATAMTQTFLECIVAPGCDPLAQEILAKKKNLRVLVLSDFLTGPAQTIKAIAGGFLVQAADDQREDRNSWQVVTEKHPDPEQIAELTFAWKVCKHVKSNAITITKNKTTLGVGAGQMNRVGAVEIALKQAGEKAAGACLASDAFFPFDDSVRTAAAAGITTIIQPGGSLRDQDSIEAANELGLVMIFTGMRHFLH